MRRLNLFIVLLLLLFASTGVLADDNKAVSVTAEGFSYMGDDDTIKEARAKALAEAERNALEEGTAVYIDSSTEVKNFQLSRDEIRKRVRGELRKRKILKAMLNRSELKYYVKIQAEVVMIPISAEELAQKKEEPEEVLPEVAARDVPEEEEKQGDAEPDLERAASLKDRPAMPEGQKPPAKDMDAARAPSKADVERFRRHLLVLKHKKPHLYVQALMTFEPRLNNSERFAAMIRDRGRHKIFLERRVKNALRRFLPKNKSTDPLVHGLKGARVYDPKTFIRVVEMVMPEMLPVKLAERMAQIRDKNPRIFRRLVEIIKKAA